MMTVNPPSKAAFWTGWVLTVVPGLMLIASAVMKFLKPEGFADDFAKLGWPEHLANYLGVIELVSAILYLIPQTAVLGAVLLTGYLGGAIATHVRLGEPFFVQAAIGVVLWLALFLRDPRLRTLLPVRS